VTGVQTCALPISQFTLTHSVHLVAEDGKWKWILPSWRYRDYRADKCPTDSTAPPGV